MQLALPAVRPRTHAEVSYDVFQGLLWTFVALDIVFVVARIVIRLKTFKRLFLDDLFATLALALFITSAVLWKYNLFRIYFEYDAAGGRRPFDQAAIDSWDKFLHFLAPFNILFYSSLWAVKLSFLAFFRKMGTQLRTFEIWWWFVTAITVASWVACIADIQWECTRPIKSVVYILSTCGQPKQVKWVVRTLWANCGLDIVTDVLILSIPVSILWNTGVPLRKKIILCSIFSATVVIMIISIVRVTVVQSTHQHIELAWLYLWSNIETGIAIVISCVASFRQLFVSKHESQAPAVPSPSSSWFKKSAKRSGAATSLPKIPNGSKEGSGHNKPASQDSDYPLQVQASGEDSLQFQTSREDYDKYGIKVV